MAMCEACGYPSPVHSLTCPAFQVVHPVTQAVLQYEFREEHYSFEPPRLKVIAVFEDKSTKIVGDMTYAPGLSLGKIIHSANEWIRAKEAQDGK